MHGLLGKAQQLRARLGLDAREAGEEFVFDAESGISREDQKEILGEIERVARQSRITVTPEALALKAAKRGVLFPIAVNASLLAVLVAGLGGLYLLFQRGESQIAREEAVVVTAEGKLIAELKKESQAELEKKNREIDSIQDRLAQIDKDRQDLQSNMDAKIKAREEELRQRLEADLAAERERLRGQGLSDQEVAKRIAELEARKESESAKQLDTFRAQADAERRKAEESLKALEADYNANLAKANQERQQVLADSRRREEELRAQLETRTATLESEKAKAESQLKAIADREQKEELAQTQLMSLYAVARGDIASRDYDDAVQSLKAIRAYVSQGEVSQLPAISSRREADLFIVDTLTAYAQAESEKARTETASLVALTSQLTDIKAKVADADRMARAGKTAEAGKLYGEALEVLPEVSRSHAFFIEQARTLEAARQETLKAGLGRAEAAFTSGRWSDALALYKDALAYLPEDAARVEKTVLSLSAAGYEETSSRARRDQTEKAAPAVTSALQGLKEKRYEDALPLFLGALASYPQSADAPKAIQGIADSVQGLEKRAEATLAEREAALNLQVADAMQKLTEASRDNVGLQAKLQEAAESIASLQAEKAQLAQDRETQIAEWKKQLAAAEEQRKTQAAHLQELSSSLGEEQARQSSLREKLAAAEAKVSDLETKLSAAPAGAGSSSEMQRLKQELASAQEAERKAASDLAERDKRIAELGVQLEAALKSAKAQQTVQEQLAALPTAEKALTDALNADYKAFTDRLSKLDPALLEQNVLEQGRALSYRNTFFSTQAMKQAFPGLLQTVRKYDAWFIADGRKDVIKIVTDLIAKPTPRERRSFLDQKLKDYEGNADMIAFIRKLEPLSR